ncbi:asparagine synthase (glutamine-hydrolyzing) [Microscilla marina]|uniref:asparagine synthase (glutamine-hydrolyzing) n=1 Tax=Microscilla marina ATCC 23134 TaxID=313606 RepID=A1ZYT2_MICM2|nr:asparagine synthase (glutamine-hydrolyzing) [Microscilla marina]EAY24429.1 asparagine synthase (glutamine-hydrolyzing) [Microscilla marina ATCC 23134]
MCGITGIYAFNELGRFFSINLQQATLQLNRRGPDFLNTSLHERINLGHTRLSIIDPNPAANQPMTDPTERYTIVFNGEIYNYREIRQNLQNQGVEFSTESDTEVVLQAYIHQGVKCLQRFNGFFAFAIYDEQTQRMLFARDRLGIKPLLIYQDEDKLIFGSEMKALIRFGIEKEIDYVSLKQYLQLNYIPQPYTMLKKVRKLPAGHYLIVEGRKNQTEEAFYQIPYQGKANNGAKTYEEAQSEFAQILERSVQQRLVSDVPLGSFLSGGIDSSVIATLAARHTDQLHTFSIGYKDEPFFDETNYAQLVAKKIGAKHTVFSVSNQDMLDHIYEILNYIDEPFADSSAIAVYILSQRTKAHVTVALSGDGADELFSGYNKHAAEYRLRQNSWKVGLVKSLSGVWNALPKSRSSKIGNKIRQLARFAEGAKLSVKDRYWSWATFAQEGDVDDLFNEKIRAKAIQEVYDERKQDLLQHLQHEGVEDFNELLLTDMQLVLPSDMLTKVDLMSMANGLEVRVPFLDHEVVNFGFSLPAKYKIDANYRKKIVQDTFRDVLPKELYQRPKKGFEVPLLKWLRHDLHDMVMKDLLSDEFVEKQAIFKVEEVQKIKQKLLSNNPEDTHARVWGLLVFQHWWKKWFA